MFESEKHRKIEAAIERAISPAQLLVGLGMAPLGDVAVETGIVLVLADYVAMADRVYSELSQGNFLAPDALRGTVVDCIVQDEFKFDSHGAHGNKNPQATATKIFEALHGSGLLIEMRLDRGQL